VAATEFLWQFASIALIVFGCWSIARKLFPEARAQWAGVAMVAAMFTLPVAGTALYLVDQHLHPRTMATAFILLAVRASWRIKGWQAALLLLLAFVLHPIMGAMGISFCFFLAMVLLEPVRLAAALASGRNRGQIRVWRGCLCPPGLGLRAAQSRLARRP
jgi:hypothetical protein